MSSSKTKKQIRAAILEEIERRAPHYTPEWRYNPASPDAGAALAFIWADMFSGTLERFNRLPDNFRRALLDVLGSEQNPPLRARGYLAFEPLPQAREAVEVPAGTGVASPKNLGAVLLTDRDLTVTSAKVDGIYYADPDRDMLRSYDKTENITLFEASDKGEHTWTLFHPYAFNVGGAASLRLKLDIKGGAAELLTVANWEFEDGDEWRKPESLTPDSGGLLLRFPPERGGCCRALRFTVGGEEFRGMELLGVRAEPFGYELFPDALYCGDAQQPESGLYPFGERLLPGGCFLVACDDALGKPGATVSFSFNLRFDKFPIEGYPPPYIHWKNLMRESELLPPEEYEIAVSKIAWEYYNGVGWAALPVSEGGQVFCEGGSGRCTLKFTCPTDIRPAVCGAHELLFIRARIILVDNLFRMYGYTLAPYISSLRFSYRFSSALSVERASVAEHLDVRGVILKTPEMLMGSLPGPAALYLAFKNRFTQGSMLFELEERLQTPSLRWEYFSESGWTSLDVQDDTANLGRTGCAVYQTPTPAVPTRMFGREAHWMRLVDIENAYTDARRLPRLRRIYQNAVNATAKIPGEESNLHVGGFTALTTSVAGISTAFNPLPTIGGTAIEPEEHVISRVTDSLSHSERAITGSDCERLAMAASIRVCRARCYPNTDEQGKPSPGCTSVVVLFRAAEKADFEALGKSVREFIEQRRPLGSGGLRVVEPRYIAVGVTVFASIDTPDRSFSIKRGINEALARFLNPISGGPEYCGWSIGELPTLEMLTSALRGVSGLRGITNLQASYLCGGIPTGRTRALREPFALPVNGSHTIILES